MRNISCPKNLMYKLPNLIDHLIDKCSLVFLNILSIHQPTSTYVLNISQRIPKYQLANMLNVCKCFAGKYHQIATSVKLHGTTHRLRNQLGSNFLCMGVICFCGIANNLKRDILRENILRNFFCAATITFTLLPQQATKQRI